MASRLPYNSSASARHSSVFPTPVGPENSKVATGRCSSRIPLRPRRTVSATASTALSCPITVFFRVCSRLRSRSRWLAVRRPTGIPVLAETAQATSPAVTIRGRLICCGFATIRCILSRSSAAFSNLLSRTAACNSCSSSRLPLK